MLFLQSKLQATSHTVQRSIVCVTSYKNDPALFVTYTQEIIDRLLYTTTTTRKHRKAGGVLRVNIIQ